MAGDMKERTLPAGAHSDTQPGRRWINPRVVALIAGLMAAIAGSVIATDLLSPRDRHPVPSPAMTGPAATRTSMGGGT